MLKTSYGYSRGEKRKKKRDTVRLFMPISGNVDSNLS